MITTPLQLIRFEPAFLAWLRAARFLLQQGVEPSDVEWIETDSAAQATPVPDLGPMRFNDTFLALARLASFHRSTERWNILYRVLWRLTHGQSRLLNELLDPDVNRLHGMARDVEKEARHLVATAHFIPVDAECGTVQIGWFIPKHHSVEIAAPTLARQIGDQNWSLLTPDRCAHWNGRQLVFSPGEKLIGAGSPRQLERIWSARHAYRFDLKTHAAAAVAAPHERSQQPRPPQRDTWSDLPLFRERK